MSQTEIDLPSLSSLGNDLIETTSIQRWIALSRPFLCLFAYIIAFSADLFWVTPFLVFLLFIAVVTVTHDVVHGSLGLSSTQTDWALFIFGALLLESGHAYRSTHSRHHTVFPGSDDPEGYPAHISFWQAVIYGPVFLPRLWLWAYARNKGNHRERRWLISEAIFPLVVVLIGLILWPVTYGLIWYVVLVIVGSWVYPLLTVHLPHRHFGDTPLNQTHTLRGIIIPALFLELTYHLEHHLYPQVPSHNLPELSRRLTPYFQAAGVKPVRVP
ncbi:MAG: fatty acid desaturase [Planctomycetaceae bacterium]|nr:fatty acid desaturase [Planctomycetaceae bacterium]